MDRHVVGCPCQGFLIAVWYVSPGLRINELLGKPHVNELNHGGFVTHPNQKVIRLDISVNKIVFMEVLKSLHQLYGYH